MSDDIKTPIDTDGYDDKDALVQGEDTVFEPDYGDKEAFLPHKAKKKGFRNFFRRKNREEEYEDSYEDTYDEINADDDNDTSEVEPSDAVEDDGNISVEDVNNSSAEEATAESQDDHNATEDEQDEADADIDDTEEIDDKVQKSDDLTANEDVTTEDDSIQDRAIAEDSEEIIDDKADEMEEAEDGSDTSEDSATTEKSEETASTESDDDEVENSTAEETYDELDDELGIEKDSFGEKIVRYFKEGGHPFEVVLIAVLVLVGISFVPWGESTGNFLKDFNLLSDLYPAEADSAVETTDMIDPALEAEMQRIALGEGPVVPKMADDTIPAISGQGGPALVENPPLDTLPQRNIGTQGPIVNGEVIIEDYTYDASGMKNLRKALANRKARPVRIAMIGDSYIEGDIITSDLRDMFQSEYGGRGVGYLAAHNIVQGFRPTVKHKDSGWTQKPISQAANTKYFTLAGEYYTGANGATLTYTGVDKDPKLQSWNNSRLIFVAPSAGKITLTADGKTHTYDVQPSPGVQSVVLPAETTQIHVQSNVSGLILLGVWLEDGNGVVLDNMSVRGDSGISRRNVNVSLADQLRQYVDYDLIIVEYGINALSSKQTDYTNYANMMANVLQRLRQCYPNADIIMMGIGDRGQKFHGEPHSFPTAQNMVDYQRQAAKDAGVLFWDTRQAMGGDDAIVRWREQGLANADYIHLNFNGGKKLAEELYKSINTALRKK